MHRVVMVAAFSIAGVASAQYKITHTYVAGGDESWRLLRAAETRGWIQS